MDPIVSLAEQIEIFIYKEFPYGSRHAKYRADEEKKYKAKIRSRFLNLKDKNNPSLRERVLAGEIMPEEFVKMSSEEMASEEMRKRDRKLQEENLFKSRGAQDTEAETDQFKCGKCKQRKTKYFQMQTRSADEPMTTFVTCVVCNNRWKVRTCSSYQKQKRIASKGCL
jgi:transcription elongation factor S-II